MHVFIINYPHYIMQIEDIGFINTNIIDEFLVKKHPAEAEDNLLRSLIKNQNKDTILFPYNGP